MTSAAQFKFGQRKLQRNMLLTLVFLGAVLWVVLVPGSARQPKEVPGPQDNFDSGTGGGDHTPSPNVIHVGGVPDEPEILSPPSGSQKHTVVTFMMSNTMASAWRASSERLTFPTKASVHVPGSGLHEQSSMSSARATLYGKSSLKIKYTKRRSLHMQFEKSFRLAAGGPEIKNVVLLSLWEDTYRLAYRSSVELLRQLGIFYPEARLVELRCEALPSAVPSHDGNMCEGGATLGTYLLLEYPSDAIERAAQLEVAQPRQRVCESSASFAQRRMLMESIAREQNVEGHHVPVEVGTRNWFYFERPKKYDILHVPSYKRNSTISASYSQLEKDPLGWSIEVRGGAMGQQSFDLDAYLTWIAVNSVLMNGDYDDEVFFYRTGGTGAKSTGLLSVMAWDYDTVFAKCHRKEAVPSRIMYCAETPIEQKIVDDPRVQQRYRDILNCVVSRVATSEKWEAIVLGSLQELDAIMKSSAASAKSTFDDTRHPPDPRKGASMLVGKLKDRVSELLATLPAVGNDDVPPELPKHDAAPQPEDGAAKHCDAVTMKRKYAALLKKGVSREHKAGRGAVDLTPLPKGSTVSITFPVTPSDPVLRVETVLGGSSLPLQDPGLYCANITIPCGASASSSWLQPFVLRSKERGSAEFALTHFTKPDPMQLVSSSTKVEGDLKLVTAVPVKWLHEQWYPVVLRATNSDGSQWVRRNFAVELTEGAGEGKTLLVRGFAAVRIATASSGLSNERDGPVLITASSDGAQHLRISGGDGGGASATLTRPSSSIDLSNIDALPSFQGIDRLMGDQCVVLLEDVTTIERGQSVTIGAGCLVVLKAGATLNVFGKLTVAGSASQPVTITNAPGDDQQWVSIVVSGEGASLHMSHTFVTGSGVKGRLTPNTGKHHKHSAAVTVVDRGIAVVEDSYFVALSGPAFAAGTRGQIRAVRSVVQWAELGVECVDCDFQTKHSTWSHFPSWSSNYEDDDNDGMYLSGGVHRVEGSVVAHAKDDCVDSGTPEKSTGDGGSLLVTDTVLEMCQHEAVALSSSPKGKRQARLTRLWIQHAQQGIENGYTGRQHRAEVEEVFIADTTVALRYGDNYYNRPQLGTLTAKGLYLEKNVANVVNYVRELGGPSAAAASFAIDESTSVFEDDATGRAVRSTPSAFLCPGIYSGSTTAENSASHAERRQLLLQGSEIVSWTV